MTSGRDSNKIHSLEHIFNLSFDKEYQMLGVELVGFDPLGADPAGNRVGALKRITTNAIGEYRMNDRVDVGTDTWVGFEDPEGDWIIQKIDQSSGTSIRYATIINNTSTTSYSDAWTNRATLTYGTYSQAF
jgi:hypothetical protein